MGLHQFVFGLTRARPVGARYIFKSSRGSRAARGSRSMAGVHKGLAAPGGGLGGTANRSSGAGLDQLSDFVVLEQRGVQSLEPAGRLVEQIAFAQQGLGAGLIQD